MILDELVREVLSLIDGEGAEVADFAVGISYTYVVVEGPLGVEMGVSTTPLEDLAGGPYKYARRPALYELPELAASLNPLERALGVAALNAASQYAIWRLSRVEFKLEGGGVIDSVVKRGFRRVLVVGHMPPLVERLERAGVEVYVVERDPYLRGRRAHHDYAIFRLAKGVEAVVATGSTLVNDSVDLIAGLGKPLYLVGPTASVYPAPLFARGVRGVGGMRIRDVEKAAALLRSPQRPILLLPKREGSPASRYVSPGLSEEGVFVPYTALHYRLLEHTRDGFLIMTSGNVHGRPMCTSFERASRELRGVVDFFLDHGLEIAHRVDDSVLRRTDGEWVFLRRSRGYAPMWLKSPVEFKRPVVAFGAELSNAGAVAFKRRVVPTQYIGDTDDFDALMDLDRELRWFSSVYKLKDPVLVCDLNPSYSSAWLCRRWGEGLNAEVYRVQHHHAHALSAVFEYGERGPFAAVAIDGVGHGPDGSAWGGEVLEVYGAEFKRVGHLRPIPMPGGDSAALRPIKMAAGYAYAALGAEEGARLLERLGADGGPLIKLASAASLYTSSLGRFLDAVAAALGVADERTYEGEPAMKLEALARGGRPLKMEPEARGGVVDTASFFVELVEAYLSGASPRDVAYTAQFAVGKALGEVACGAADGGVIYVSGGASVNDYVVKGLKAACREVRLQRAVPPGDGGIAVGQCYYAGLREGSI